MEDITKVVSIGTLPEYQEYSTQDLTLIQQYQISSAFDPATDYIESYVNDLNDTLLCVNDNVISYKLDPKYVDSDGTTSRALLLEPALDVNLCNTNIDRGQVIITYNFYRKLLTSSPSNTFWIKEISSDRTELKVANQNLSSDQLTALFEQYQQSINNLAYYPDFQLNFGRNQTIIGVNLLAGNDPVDGDIVYFVKLYEALPQDLDVKDTFWFVSKLAEPAAFEVTIEAELAEVSDTTPRLRGPNFNVDAIKRVGQTLPEYSYNDLITANASSSYQQLKSLLEEKGVEINVDYTDFGNFVHFSSVAERIYNFEYKVKLIESYSADLNTLTNNTVQAGNTTVIGSTKTVLQNKINNIIEKFDGYEYYLYYESGSLTWPKRTETKPYQLYSVSSSQVADWLGSPVTEPSPGATSILYSASRYDNLNKDLFLNTIPSYLRDDESNRPYELFLDMVGQHFDNIWIYLKDVTERFNASNNLTVGISKDLVAATLQGLGINLYTNTNISNNLYYSVLGYNNDGSLLPPTGSEHIDFYVTSSLPTMAAEDVTLEYYKRIYHNLPYLLKTKGTERGLRALINCYGIPDTILRINEYGGVVKNSDYGGYIQNRFSLAYSNDYTSSVIFPWAPATYTYYKTGNSNIVPDAVEFRFKTKGIPETGYYSQSLFQVGQGSDLQFGLGLHYDNSSTVPDAVTTSSFSNYGYLTFYLNGGSGVLSTTPIYLPFYDENQWWTVLVQRNLSGIYLTPSSQTTYTVYVKSAFYNEEGISRVGFQASASITTSDSSYNNSWINFNPAKEGSFNAYLGGTDSVDVISPDNHNFNGYFQEFRYWSTPISESVFNKHVLNSTDYSLDIPTGSLFNLILRAPLGNNLTVPYIDENGNQLNDKDYDQYLLGQITIDPNTIADSIHPAITGTFYIPEYGSTVTNIQSFFNGPMYGYGIFSPNNYRNFVKQEFVDLLVSPVTGISQKVNNKVIVDTTTTGSFPVDYYLHPQVSLEKYNVDRTISTGDIEVAFSPADVIDDDVTNQFGNFLIDEYIGRPSDRYTRNYIDLNALSNLYFSKYVNSFNFFDFVRLLKYIDNSLFKLIKDFVPARADVATGVVVKPHILERSKYQRYEPIISRHDYTASIDTAFIEASTPEGANYQTAYSMSIMTPSGSAPKLYPNYLAQYTGEFSGSIIEMFDGRSPVNFPQTDVSNVIPVNTALYPVPRDSWYFVTYSLDPLLNNVTESRKSTRLYDLDYSTDQVLPVNYNLITYSMDLINQNNPQYSDPYIPWAKVQDSNYQSKVFTLPRYEGSKTTSKLYSTYSLGDTSYGKTAAIDKIKFQYAYLVDIYTGSLTLPSRSNAQIKYLVDDREDVLDLTKENNNIFDVQNIYKGGETCNISLFDYTNEATIPLTNKQVPIYEGGFRYVPLLHNIRGEATAFSWSYDQPQEVITVQPGTGGGTPVDCSTEGVVANWTNPNYYIPTWTTTNFGSGATLTLQTATYIGPGGAASLPTTCTLFVYVRIRTIWLNRYMCYSYPTDPNDPSYKEFAEYGPFTFTPGGGTTSQTLNVQIQGFNTCPEFDPATLGGFIEFYTAGISAGYPLGYRYSVSNTTGANVTYTYRGYCDQAQQAYVIPPGLSTICIHPQESTPVNGGGLSFVSLGNCTDCGVVPPITYVDYTSTGEDEEVCLEIPASSPSQPAYTNRLIKFSAFLSKAIYEETPVTFQDESDPATATSPIEPVVLPFSLQPGDAIHFYSSSLGWSEKEEYRVVTTFFSGSVGTNTTNQRFYAVVDRSINRNVFTTQPTSPDIDGTVCKFIIAKHLPDETNVILRYNPLDPDVLEEGILYPQYIEDRIRKNAGNIIKSLKSQGLI
jgi:hypothetical protein